MAGMEASATIEKVNRSPIVKFHIVGGDRDTRQQGNSASADADVNSYQTAGAIAPPYDPRQLALLYEKSSALRPNVDAYASIIDGNGHHFEPLINLEGDDAREKVADAIYLERLVLQEAGKVVPTLEPTDKEIDLRMEQLKRAMRVEEFRLKVFFDGCTVKESFPGLRRKTREDMEVTGNGYWEVTRYEKSKKLAQFNYLPSHSMRLMPEEVTPFEVDLPVRASPLELGKEKVPIRFRKFVQLEAGKMTYFKEYGDPRVMSASSGEYFTTAEAMKVKEQHAREATEVLHFRIHSPLSPYGVPRWIGNFLNILGIYQAEEVNFLYFENKTVPPLALLVSGGRVSQDTIKSLKDFIEGEIKGKGNFHKILIIEAEPTANPDGGDNASGKMRIELRPLTDAQQKDALFQKYDERGADKVGMSFRLPRLLRGDIRDFNRATADAALEFTEVQVFGPLRGDFDFIMKRILLDLGVRYWTFISNSVQIRDPKVLSTIIEGLTKVGCLVPADARELAGELVFGRDLGRIDADWAYQPIMLTQVGIGADQTLDGKIPAPGGGAEVPTPGGQPPRSPAGKAMGYRGGRRPSDRELAAQAREMVRVKKALETAEAAEAQEEFLATKKEGEAEKPLGTVVIRMPAQEMVKRFHLVTDPPAAQPTVPEGK